MATITLDKFNRSLSDLVRTGAIGEAIHRATAEVGIRAVESSQRNYLRGPRPAFLGRVSGALARSVRFKTTPRQDHIKLTLSAGGGPAQVDYAAIHEYGFSGSGEVKQHTRSTAFGRPVAPFTVGPYTRNMTIRPRPYLRPGRDKALKEAPRIFTSEIGRTIRRGLEGL